jgi:hypothetical protein
MAARHPLPMFTRHGVIPADQVMNYLTSRRQGLLPHPQDEIDAQLRSQMPPILPGQGWNRQSPFNANYYTWLETRLASAQS